MALIQVVLTVLLFCSLPLWKGGRRVAEKSAARPLSLQQIMSIPGTKVVMAAFFCYCGLETTAALWSASYLVLHGGMAETEAARFAGLFYLGMTVGRGLSGFVTMRLNDRQMIRLGQVVTALGLLAVLLPLGKTVTLAGLLLTGLGCAPIYPCFIHATPTYFGVERSQAIIGVQMASAYVGTSLMPPIFGLLAEYVTPALYPVYLLVTLVALVLLHERLIKEMGR